MQRKTIHVPVYKETVNQRDASQGHQNKHLLIFIITDFCQNSHIYKMLCHWAFFFSAFCSMKVKLHIYTQVLSQLTQNPGCLSVQVEEWTHKIRAVLLIPQGIRLCNRV